MCGFAATTLSTAPATDWSLDDPKNSLVDFNYPDADLILSCRSSWSEHNFKARVHQSKVFAAYPGMRKNLVTNVEEPKFEARPVQVEGEEKDSDDGMIDLPEEEPVTVHASNAQESSSLKESTDQPKLWEAYINLDILTTKILLAYIYDKPQYLELNQYPQVVRGNVWQAAADYQCKNLLLYAESSILMSPDAITSPFALDMCDKAKQHGRENLYKALVPYTLREDLLSICRNKSKEARLLNLGPRDMLDMARFHVHAALYNEGYIRRAKAKGMLENNISIAAASSLCNHGIEIKLKPDHSKKRLGVEEKELRHFSNRDHEWGHWPSAEAHSIEAPSKWNSNDSWGNRVS